MRLAGKPAGAFVAVAAGISHSCAIKTDGTIKCWGKGDNGRTSVPENTIADTYVRGTGASFRRTLFSPDLNLVIKAKVYLEGALP